MIGAAHRPSVLASNKLKYQDQVKRPKKLKKMRLKHSQTLTKIIKIILSHLMTPKDSVNKLELEELEKIRIL
jgi:hypothetical protein